MQVIYVYGGNRLIMQDRAPIMQKDSKKKKKRKEKKRKERKKVCNTKGESINNPQHQGFMQYANQWHQPPNTDTASIQGRASAQ